MSQTIMQSFIANPSPCGPFGEALSLAVMGEIPICTSVSILLYSGCPVAIVGIVSLVIITSLNRVLRGWARPNVLVKHPKRILPSFAYRYSPAAIILKAWIVGVITPGFHFTPRVVFGRFGHSVGKVRLVCGASVFLLLAATGLRVAATQMAQRHHSHHAAPANAFPEHAPNYLLTLPCSGPVSELCPGGYIVPSCHSILLREKLWRSGPFAASTVYGPPCIVSPRARWPLIAKPD